MQEITAMVDATGGVKLVETLNESKEATHEVLWMEVELADILSA
jgi:hypothetical protein